MLTRASTEAWLAAHQAAWPYALALNGTAIVAALAAAGLAWTVNPYLIALVTAALLSVIGAVVQIVVANRAARQFKA